jgi:hypothetical protein
MKFDMPEEPFTFFAVPEDNGWHRVACWVKREGDVLYLDDATIIERRSNGPNTGMDQRQIRPS